ncbi:hypothetical protein ACHAXM_002416 [Skeletonema potamos]
MHGNGNSNYDDRFYTPRASASAMSSRSHASASSLATSRSHDRFYTPRAAFSAHSQGSNRSQTSLATARSNFSSSSASDNSYRTSRSTFSSPSHYLNNRKRPPKPGKNSHSGIISALDSELDLEAAPLPMHRPSTSMRRTIQNNSRESVQDIFSLARHARVSEVEALLIRGVPITSRDENGNGILSIGCQNGSKRIAKLALRFGADINEQNESGNTALHYCYLYQKEALGKYLIKKGADTTIRNHQGRLFSEVTS